MLMMVTDHSEQNTFISGKGSTVTVPLSPKLTQEKLKHKTRTML